MFSTLLIGNARLRVGEEEKEKEGRRERERERESENPALAKNGCFWTPKIIHLRRNWHPSFPENFTHKQNWKGERKRDDSDASAKWCSHFGSTNICVLAFDGCL
jgi:hypothetical protein